MNNFRSTNKYLWTHSLNIHQPAYFFSFLSFSSKHFLSQDNNNNQITYFSFLQYSETYKVILLIWHQQISRENTIFALMDFHLANGHHQSKWFIGDVVVLKPLGSYENNTPFNLRFVAHLSLIIVGARLVLGTEQSKACEIFMWFGRIIIMESTNDNLMHSTREQHIELLHSTLDSNK